MTLSAQRVGWTASGKTIVDGVTLDVRPGSVLGLVGPNGSGKSSLLRLLCRLRRVASGVVRLDGREIDGFPRRELARRLAFVEQQGSTEVQLTACDVVRLGRTPHRAALASWSEADERAVTAALERVGLANRHEQPWHTLSGGERQRVQIARALAQAPSELILDEPTNHLDIRHQLSILALVRRLGVTCIVALHDLNLASLFCDEIAVMDEGRLVAAGTPEQALTPELIKRVFGVDVLIRADAAGRRHIEYLIEPDTTASVTAYWNGRAPAFDGVASHVAKFDEWRRVLEAAFEADGAKDVVDLGTGTGACALVAASLGHRVRGYDGSAGMLAAARAAAGRMGLDIAFEIALIDGLPIADASADIVTLRNVLWTLADPPAALARTRRILRPGGRIVVSDGQWSVAPQYRSTYPAELATQLPLHAGLGEDDARRMLTQAGFGAACSWQHLFAQPPYPGDVPFFVLSAPALP